MGHAVIDEKSFAKPYPQIVRKHISDLTDRAKIERIREKEVHVDRPITDQSERGRVVYRKIEMYPEVFLPHYRSRILKLIKEDKGILFAPSDHSSRWALIFNLFGPLIETEFEHDFMKHVFGFEGKMRLQRRLSEGKEQGSMHRFDMIVTEPNGTQNLVETRYTEPSFESVLLKKRDDERKHIGLFMRVKDLTYGLVYEHRTKSPKTTISYLEYGQLCRMLYGSSYELQDEKIVLKEKASPMHIIISRHVHEHLQAVEDFNRHIRKNKAGIIRIHYWENLIDLVIDYARMTRNTKLIEHAQALRFIYCPLVKEV